MNYRKYFSQELITDLTNQVLFQREQIAKSEEDNTVDIFYNVDDQSFNVFRQGKHNWTDDDADFVLWDSNVKGEIEEVIGEILGCFVEEFDIPEGGFNCRPISWKSPPFEHLIIEDVQLLSPDKQAELRDDLLRLTDLDGFKCKSFAERTEYHINFFPEKKPEILAILNRYV